MTLPPELRREVEARLGEVRAPRPVGGGCINECFRVDLPAGPAFLKYNLRAPAGFFAAEAEGLGALRAAAGDGLRVPAVLALGDETPWIALEWLEPAPRAPGFSERLGRGLARLHRPDGGGWGWGADNFIGPLPQPNEPAASWAEFWRARRLEPQLRRAHDVGRRPGSAREWERLFAALDGLLAPAGEDGPSLLHGDLWSGNVLATTAGPALVDPAVYRGHREVDLAMAELFGGFDAAFHAAYAEAAPLRPGYREARRGVYQLYPLLVHAVLFGGGYVAQAAETLRRVPAG